MDPFFITGYPRSRTAWLANLFSADGALCHHALLSNSRRGFPVTTISQALSLTPLLRVGVSDPLLTLHHADLMTAWPAARWLYVDRPREESFESMIKFDAGRSKATREMISMLFDFHDQCAAELIKNPRVRVLKYSDLNQFHDMQAAWYHLIPGEPFNKSRFEALLKLRVEEFIPPVIPTQPSTQGAEVCQQHG
jgi:hypothetical protein